MALSLLGRTPEEFDQIDVRADLIGERARASYRQEVKFAAAAFQLAGDEARAELEMARADDIGEGTWRQNPPGSLDS